MQSAGGEIKGPAVAEPGTRIVVEVQADSAEIEVSVNGGPRTSYPVPPGRKVEVLVPPGTAGQSLFITTGDGPPYAGLSIPIVSTLQDPCKPN